MDRDAEVAHASTSSGEGEEEEDEEMKQEGAAAAAESRDYFAERVSAEEYKKMSQQYTKECVDALITTPEFLRKTTRCHLCWSVWAEGQCSAQCQSCQGYAMQRPCPICDGRCGSVWRRDVDMSLSENEAHWDGACRLDWRQREGLVYEKLIDSGPQDEQDMVDDMKWLTTDSWTEDD